MSDQPDESVLEMPIELLRERVSSVLAEMKHVRAVLDPVLKRALLGPLGDEESSEPPIEEAMSAVQQALGHLRELLPGMVLLSPERRQYLQATTPDHETLQKMVASLPVPPRLPDSTPTALDRSYQHLLDRMERAELLGPVEEQLQALLSDFRRTMEVVRTRIARAMGELAPPPPETLN
ncbi:MAG TPA: hypothetical protein PKE31_19835 [Pseudomonadota bacterium]|nr:hypothetical protein [Pseudomonadota bacterium]